jgi:hypothetical protein
VDWAVMGYLTERQVEILQCLRAKSTSSGKLLFEQVLTGKLPVSDIQAVCEMINDEYLMKGIKENYDPNEYGSELEQLLDVVNRPRVV